MSRNLSAAMKTAIGAGNVRPFLLFEAEFSTGFDYLWSGHGPLVWNAITWRGIGDLISASPVDETDDVKAQGITLAVKGVQIADIERVLAELRSGRPGIIRLGLFDEAGQIVFTPKIIFRGRLDVGEIDDSDPENPIVNLGYEHELIDLERPREWRYTDQHQKKLYPGDAGLAFISSLQDKELTWGRH